MGQQGIRIGIIGVAAGAVLLAGCSSGASSGPSSATTAPSSNNSVATSAAPLDEVAAQAAAFAALPPADQESQLAATSSAAELALLPKSDAAAYNAMTAALITQARAYAGDPNFGKFGAGPVRAADGGFGGMTFAGWVISGIAVSAALNATDGMKAGAPAASNTTKDPSTSGTSELTVGGTSGNATIDWTMTSKEKGLAGSLRLKGDINPCPDVGGRFTAKVSLETNGASDNGGGNSSSTVSIDLQGLVDESAAIVGYETTSNTRASSGARGQVADVTSTTTTVGGEITAATRGANAAPGTAVDGQQWANLGQMTELMVVQNLIDAIRKSIESGRCVTLNTPTNPAKTKGLKPSTAVSISAQPRSKVDGKPTGGTVTGKLNGGSSLNPAGSPVPADATFAYVAPDKEDERATVSLEARSLRGVGKAEVPFDTVVQRGWTIGGPQGPYSFFGKSCGSAAGPWVITYTLEGIPQLKGGGVIKFTYPVELDPQDTGNSTKTTGTDRGELKAVGLPGGVRFDGPAVSKLTAWNSKFKMRIKTSGTATGYARGKQRTRAESTDTFDFVVTPAGPESCPTK